MNIGVMAWCQFWIMGSEKSKRLLFETTHESKTSLLFSFSWTRLVKPLMYIWKRTTLGPQNNLRNDFTVHYSFLIIEKYDKTTVSMKQTQLMTYEKLEDVFYSCSCWWVQLIHYSDVIMSTMASQITSPTIAFSTKENIQAPRQRPLWGEFIGHRWIPRT